VERPRGGAQQAMELGDTPYSQCMGDVIAFPPQERPETAEPEPLWREAVGHELREERLRQERTLADVSEESGVSVQYLSEVERGRKEPSSEILGAVGGRV
jgi:hypothetical protein